MKKGIQYILAGLALTGLAIMVFQAYVSNKAKPPRELPVLGNEGHRVKNFSLIDMYGKPFSHEDVKGKVYVAEFFFTTCQSICIPMNENMHKVDSAFGKFENFRIVSHTVDPEIDSPQVLLEYARKHQASPHWVFLTGEKEMLYRTAMHSYLLVEPEKNNKTPDFIHSQLFVLVDGEGKLRGSYDGTKLEEVEKLMDDVRILLPQ